MRNCSDAANHASCQFEDIMGRCSDAAIHASWKFEDVTGWGVAACIGDTYYSLDNRKKDL